MIYRRTLSLGILTVLVPLVLVLGPFVLALSLPLMLFPRLRSLPHALTFVMGAVLLEAVGVTRLFWAWVRHGRSPEFSPANRRVRFWWVRALLGMGARIYNLSFEATGREATQGSALIVARHTSIGDTVLPLVFFDIEEDKGMRYIIKSELRALPNLDIGGHRIPTYFIDRSGLDTEGAMQGVQALTAEASEDESVLIYAEGTRVTSAKRKYLHDTKPELRPYLERWPDLLPPRLGGLSAMLRGNPGKDMVFMAHIGFEGCATFGDLANGQWNNQVIRLHFWRIPFESLPDGHDTDELRTFVEHEWDNMQAHVTRMQAR